MRDLWRKKTVLALVLTLVGLGAFAQADVASPYSLFGVGQMAGKSMNVRLKGMGGLGNGMYGIGLINTANPASYAKIDSLAFLFDAGFYFKTSNFATSTLAETSNNASFDHVFMAFGLTDWWKMTLGVSPYSTMDYKMVVDYHDVEVGNYTTAFKGSGGLNRAVIGNAFKLGKHFSVGANVNYVFGDSESQTTLYFPDSTYKISTRRSVDMMVSSFKFDYGLLYNTNIGKDYSLGIGITYDQRIRLSGKQTTFIRTIAGDSDDDVEYLIETIVDTTVKAKLTMPQGFGMGFVFQKNNQWSFGADFDWTQWSAFAREGANDSLRDAWRVSVGFEYMPTYSSISNYFRKVTYRVGGFYEQSYLDLRGHALNRIGVSLGASFPLPRTQSKVNLAVEVGRFGTKQDGLIQENYLKFDVGISVFEHWFMKRKYK
jgi:long-subunit fatty acid transport protein